MNKPDFTVLAHNVRENVFKHSSEILTGVGIAGMITTTVLAVKATPKALRLIDEKRIENEVDSLTVVDTVKTTWLCYLPSIITGTISVTCLIGATSVNARRTAALTTAYKLSESALSEYKDAVVETIGEKKEQSVKDKVAKKKLEKDPISKKEVILTGKGSFLCYDAHSGRYFETNADLIKKAENELNRKMMYDMGMYVSLNDFYEEIGLKPTKLGCSLGWHLDDGLLDIDVSTQLTDNNEPCLVIDYNVAPKYDYDKTR